MDSQKLQSWSRPLVAAGIGLSAFTSGTLASMSLVTVPTILANTTNATVLACWRQSLDTGVKVAPPLALIATLVHVVNAVLNRNSSTNRVGYLAVAATSTISIVPFTLLFLSPTNQELFRRERAARGTSTSLENGTHQLIKTWGRLNLARALLPAAGALLACLAL